MEFPCHILLLHLVFHFGHEIVVLEATFGLKLSISSMVACRPGFRARDLSVMGLSSVLGMGLAVSFAGMEI